MVPMVNYVAGGIESGKAEYDALSPTQLASAIRYHPLLPAVRLSPTQPAPRYVLLSVTPCAVLAEP